MLLDLPPELLDPIICYCGIDDLKQLALCSNALNTTLRYHLWRSVSIPNRSMMAEKLCEDHVLKNLLSTSKLSVDLFVAGGKCDEKVFQHCEAIMEFCEPRVLSIKYGLTRYVQPLFRKAEHLVELQLSGSTSSVCSAHFIERSFFIELCDSLKNLMILTISNSCMDDDTLVHIEKLVSLKDLTLIKNIDTVCNRVIYAVGKLTRLTKLTLSGTGHIIEGWSSLKTLQWLEQVNLSSTNLMDKGLGYLCMVSSIKVLDISSCRISNFGIASLKSLTSLTKLNISDTQVSDIGIQELTGFQHLKVLYVSQSRVSDLSAPYFCQLPLVVLNVMETKMSDLGLEVLAAIGTLKTLYCSGRFITSDGIKLFLQTQKLSGMDFPLTSFHGFYAPVIPAGILHGARDFDQISYELYHHW